MGGIEDHIHIITHVHPDISVSQLVKDIKLSCNSFIRSEKLFDHFKGWNEGFGAFTYSPDAQKNLINYVLNQEEHHNKESSRNEYIQLLKQFDIKYNEKYL